MLGDNYSLYEKSKNLRIRILEMAKKAGGGHIGGSYSVLDVLNYLYSVELNINPLNPTHKDRDFLLFSKGHSSLALYTTLCESGFFTKKILDGYGIDGGTLAGHPEKGIAPGIEITSGSLGHGHSIGVGISLSIKLNKEENRVFVVSSDGELNEGSTWEALMSASQFELNNFYLVVDFNKLISLDTIDAIMGIDPLYDKLVSFGFEVESIDGHNFEEIKNGFDKLKMSSKNKPKALIANTIKGKGVSFMENVPMWHFRCPNDDEFKLAMDELNNK